MSCFNQNNNDPALQKAKLRDKNIKKQLLKQKKNLEREIKLLLLGAGESGKSTIFKQMKILHAKGFTDDDRISFKSVIYTNVLTDINNLIEISNIKKFQISAKNAENVKTIQAIPKLDIISKSSEAFTEKVAKAVAALWKDDGIQKAFGVKNEFQINDSAQFFFDKVEDLVKSDYKPDDQDVLRSRMRTVGVVVADFTIDDFQFKMVDVGGQRNERRKWIHVFDDVTAIIFVTSLSEFDRVLLEDGKTNRMIESIRLFEEICKVRYFRKTNIIVFFNKKDLFEEKLKVKDISCLFPEYKDGKNYKKATKFIERKFKEKCGNKRVVYPHFTCATDTSNVKHVFESAKNTILRNVLKDNNIM